MEIKKIIKEIYKFNFRRCEVKDKEEFTIIGGVCPFTKTFKRDGSSNGIIVVPSGYTNGLFYNSTNGGEIQNAPQFHPAIVSYQLAFFGLKKNAWYRVTTPCRSAGSNQFVTNDRTLKITNDNKEEIISADVEDIYDNKTFTGVFRATSTELNLFVRMGKVILSDIIIEEIELFTEEVRTTVEQNSSLEDGKMRLAAYGTFNTLATIDDTFTGRYIPVTRYSGKGLRVFYDKEKSCYIIERDNANDLLGESITNIEYIVDINFNKVVNKGKFFSYQISEVSNEVSPNTLRQGFISFELVDEAQNLIKFNDNEGIFSILVHKIQ